MAPGFRRSPPQARVRIAKRAARGAATPPRRVRDVAAAGSVARARMRRGSRASCEGPTRGRRGCTGRAAPAGGRRSRRNAPPCEIKTSLTLLGLALIGWHAGRCD
eukprot:366465-Chlamydomonas_euryale.AAC.15